MRVYGYKFYNCGPYLVRARKMVFESNLKKDNNVEKNEKISWKEVAVTVGTKVLEGILAGATMAAGAYVFGLAVQKPETNVTPLRKVG